MERRRVRGEGGKADPNSLYPLEDFSGEVKEKKECGLTERKGSGAERGKSSATR